jgi:bile-acid 7alpha-dehydratase
MADMRDLEARMKALEHRVAVSEDIEAIKRLKHKYFRCLDSKLWDELAQCFVGDATTSYTDGKYSFRGVEDIIGFLKKSLGAATVLSMHQGHQPEIDITSETTAKGIWTSEAGLIITDRNVSTREVNFYYDEYIKIKGQWKIKHTGYRRLFEEAWDRGETKSLKLMANMFAPRKE